MRRRWIGVLTVAGVLAAGLTGCDKLPFGKTASTSDDEFADLADPPSESGDRESTALGVPAPDLGPRPPATVQAAELAPKLAVGQRFPLIKTVEQRLTQKLPSGFVTGHSRLELRLSLQVEELREGRQRLSVRYHRVRYAQDLGGERFEYDSDQPLGPVPPQALAYSGLKDNGFAFWLGPDNRVIDLVGFPDFLQRCLTTVPADQRPAVLQQLASLRSDEGLANFVDDSIGLLPSPADPQWAGQPLRIGSRWNPHESLPSSGASAASKQCLLKDLTPQTAEIALVGTIGPSSYVDDIRKLTLDVRGGQCTGTCTVDRATGMPTQSRVERYVDMTARLGDGTEIPQRKEVVTTIVAYLDQGSPRSELSSSAPPGQVQPAGYSTNSSYAPAPTR